MQSNRRQQTQSGSGLFQSSLSSIYLTNNVKDRKIIRNRYEEFKKIGHSLQKEQNIHMMEIEKHRNDNEKILNLMAEHTNKMLKMNKDVQKKIQGILSIESHTKPTLTALKKKFADQSQVELLFAMNKKVEGVQFPIYSGTIDEIIEISNTIDEIFLYKKKTLDIIAPNVNPMTIRKYSAKSKSPSPAKSKSPSPAKSKSPSPIKYSPTSIQIETPSFMQPKHVKSNQIAPSTMDHHYGSKSVKSNQIAPSTMGQTVKKDKESKLLNISEEILQKYLKTYENQNYPLNLCDIPLLDLKKDKQYKQYKFLTGYGDIFLKTLKEQGVENILDVLRKRNIYYDYSEGRKEKDPRKVIYLSDRDEEKFVKLAGILEGVYVNWYIQVNELDKK